VARAASPTTRAPARRPAAMKQSTLAVVLVLAAPVVTRAFRLAAPTAQTATPARPRSSALRATIAAADVKALRDESGAGMMDCKKALVEAEGDKEKAAEWLRVKGLASAAKKGERATKEGLVETYVHTGGRLGVMVEVNCETDFVSKGPKFKELTKMVAMQIAACPGVEFVTFDEIPETAIDAERKMEMQAEDLAGKPDAIKTKIVEGRVQKLFKEKVLLEQPYIKDPKMNVDEFVKSYVATLGENIQIARFTKFELGGSVKQDDDEGGEAPAAAAEAAPEQAPTPPVAEEEEAPVVVVEDASLATLKAELKAELKTELMAELKKELA